MKTTMQWDTREYQRIVDARHQDGRLEVLFEDGSCIGLEAGRVLPPDARGVNWSRMRFNPSEIVVPTADGELEVPWSTLRVLTDRSYSAHLAEAAEEQARQIGLRIKDLRKSRGLTGKELAGRAGITPQSLSRIEQGRHDVVLTTLKRLLAAMGCSLKDLAVPAPTENRTPNTQNQAPTRPGC